MMLSEDEKLDILYKYQEMDELSKEQIKRVIGYIRGFCLPDYASKAKASVDEKAEHNKQDNKNSKVISKIFVTNDL